MSADTAEFYDRDAENYDARWQSQGGRRTAAAQRDIVEELTAGWEAARLLEVGSGTGRFSSRLTGATGFYVATDVSREMLAATRSRLRTEVDPPTSFVQASVEALPFADGAVDAFFCVNVLNHVAQIEAAIAEISRVLAPGAGFLLSFTNAWSAFAPAAFLVNRRNTALGKDVYSRWRSYGRMRDLIAAADLNVATVRGNVHIPRKLDVAFVRSILTFLDHLSRRGWLARFAPTVFLCGFKSAGAS